MRWDESSSSLPSPPCRMVGWLVGLKEAEEEEEEGLFRERGKKLD